LNSFYDDLGNVPGKQCSGSLTVFLYYREMSPAVLVLPGNHLVDHPLDDTCQYLELNTLNRNILNTEAFLNYKMNIGLT